MSTTDALLEPWPGPFGGVPPWDAIDPADFPDAFDTAIAEAEAEIDRIATDPDPPTFDNTIVALELAWRSLDRLQAMFGVHANNLNVDPVPELRRIIGPRLAAHRDRVVQHDGLFDRIRAVHDGGQLVELDEDQRRLTVDRYRRFVRNGAALDAGAKAELTAVNQRLAELYTEFGQNVLHDEQAHVTWIEDEADLAGVPDSLADALRAAAAEQGRPEAWAVRNTRASVEPFLTTAASRSKREEVWRTFVSRGGHPGEHDNRPVVAEILRLRAERATLLGYETHAHWRLEDTMATTPEAAMALMMEVWPTARARAEEEIADLALVAGLAPHDVEPWDHRYHAEQVRKERYDLDVDELTPYLQLERLIEAMHWCSGELFGLRYERVASGEDGVPVFHPDVRVWQVTDDDGTLRGLWYLDPYARDGKHSGAWMTDYRPQHHIDEPVPTLVSNNSNFVAGPAGEPVLVSWDDARTLFHEFGHALHGLLSDVRYPSQSGTSVPPDYVEFPSQLNEHWLTTPEVLTRFLRHATTDRPMPAELVDKIERAATFNQGFDTVEYLAAALVDLQLHLAEPPVDPVAFERVALAELGMPPQIVMRHRIPHFSHLFDGDAYSAGYYSYLWSDALTADAAEAFTEAGGFYDREVARRLRHHVLSVGDTVDPAEGFRAFRGRDVDTRALFRKRGFPVDGGS